MAKQVISVDGQDQLVREDAAKAFRGVHWALLSIAAFILIMLALFVTGIIRMSTDNGIERNPAEVERDAGR